MAWRWLDRLRGADAQRVTETERPVLRRRVARALESARRRDERCLLLRLQIAGLEEMDDEPFVRSVWRVVIERLRREVREDDLLARSAEHEFTVLAQGIDVFPRTAATAIASRLTRNLTSPYGIEGRRVELDVRIGIASFPDDAVNAEGLLLAASHALHVARRSSEPWRFAAPMLKRRER
ncbi:MAG TPA: diguanylate cyclase [Rhodanobacteraceae bacterium]|nr:diguanylate cyclase [Rhodanobacteraceae bacterium]